MLDMPQFQLNFSSFSSYHEGFPYTLEAKTLSRTGTRPAYFVNLYRLHARHTESGVM